MFGLGSWLYRILERRTDRLHQTVNLQISRHFRFDEPLIGRILHQPERASVRIPRDYGYENIVAIMQGLEDRRAKPEDSATVER